VIHAAGLGLSSTCGKWEKSMVLFWMVREVITIMIASRIRIVREWI
jgi:hypothetical protein